jgi:hypothetical protein
LQESGARRADGRGHDWKRAASFEQFLRQVQRTICRRQCIIWTAATVVMASFRRQRTVLQPSAISANIAPMKATRLAWKQIIHEAGTLSQAEIVRAIDDAVKTAILDERNELRTEDIVARLIERHAMRSAFLDRQGA